MPSVPNQKTIVVHKDKVVSDFLQINNAEWMEVNKKFGPYALQLYLYLAKNADGYKFALSPAAAREEAGIKKTSYNTYLKLLETAGYVVKRSGNTYDFYTTPHIAERRQMKKQQKIVRHTSTPVIRLTTPIDCFTNRLVRHKNKLVREAIEK